MDTEYFIIRPLYPTPTVYQKQIKEEKLNQYIFDDKLYPGLVLERLNIRHDGHYSQIDIDDFKRGDFWFCTYDGSMISQEKYEQLKNTLPLDEWYNYDAEYQRWRLHIKIKYFFISLKHRLTKK